MTRGDFIGRVVVLILAALGVKTPAARPVVPAAYGVLGDFSRYIVIDRVTVPNGYVIENLIGEHHRHSSRSSGLVAYWRARGKP